MNKKTFCGGVATGVIAATIAFGALNFTTGIAKSKLDFTAQDKLEYIDALLNKYYVDGVDNDKLYEGACYGMAAGVGDPYTTYLSKNEVTELLEDTSGSFCGIGVGVLYDNNKKDAVISYVMDNSPAKEAGLLSGDVFKKVDGKDLSGLDIDSIIDLVRGDKGTDVSITVTRKGVDHDLTFNMKRNNVDVTSVKSEVLDNDIGYMYISGFKSNTYAQFMENLNKLKKSNVKGLIIDVRDNPGGVVDGVEKIADELLPKCNVVYTIDKNGNREDFNSDAACTDLPLVMLVNGNSASASEILSGAIQANKRGKLVGTQTFGKGLVQSIYSIPDGSALKVTIQKYYTPAGVCIQGVGLTPDVVVERQDDYPSVLMLKHSEDVQLQKAIEVLNDEIK
ncbi:MAG: S41 family peptidase [Clostridia bacterium]|jgi:carboxyl-terminal processing protease|nr:S41 family peptidase [Clostridia bacterium]MCI2001049.1 S41 family peptidase [Clostridia bacterium]MCI2015648.1 S41 family peptidase [Clostridia bacterium]